MRVQRRTAVLIAIGSATTCVLIAAGSLAAAGSTRTHVLSAGFAFAAAPVAHAATTTTYAGRVHSHELQRSGAIVYTTRPAGDTRRADFTIYLSVGTLRGYMVTPNRLPTGQDDPMIAGGTERITRGTGRFHGMAGYGIASDDAGPGAPPTITSDGVHRQVLDLCLAPAAQASRACPH